MLHFVDACEAERGCGAAALIKVIVTSSLESVMVIVSSFFASVTLTRSLCTFLLIEPIFYGLWQC